jgi:protein O-mannosyl-transferase
MKVPRSRVLFPLLLLVCVFAAYSTAIGGGTIWDDDAYVTGNPTLRSAEGLRQIWLEPRSIPQYYPLVHTTFWIEWHLWGAEPLGYHLNNVLLHAMVAILAWLVLLRLRIPGAGIAAFVFALHPVTVESAAWITERKNVLSGVLYLAAMLTYFRFEPPEGRDETRPRRWGLWCLTLLLFLGALLSKSVTSSLPAAILLLFWWKRGRLGWRDFLPLLPMFLLGALLGLHTSHLEQVHVGAMGAEWDFSFVERCLIAGRGAWFYLGKALWPVSLAFIYPRWEIDAGAWWQYLFPIGAVGLVATLLLLRHRIGRAPLTALLFFGGTLFPALGFFNVYPMRYSFVADHFQYLAIFGPIVLLVSSGAILLARRRELALGVSIVVLVILGTLTWRQGRIYEGKRSLWEDTLAKNPEGWMPNYNLANLHREAGDLARAEALYRKTLEVKPDSAEALANLAGIRMGQQRFAEARAFLREALDTGFREAHLRNLLGGLAEMEGDPGEAERQYRLGMKAGEGDAMPGSRNAMPTLNVARLLARRGEVEGARELLRRAVDLEPNLVEARVKLARALLGQGEIDEAMKHLDRALLIQPDDLEALYLRGRIHLERGEREESRALVDRILRADPRYPERNPDLRRMIESLGGR